MWGILIVVLVLIAFLLALVVENKFFKPVLTEYLKGLLGKTKRIFRKWETQHDKFGSSTDNPDEHTTRMGEHGHPISFPDDEKKPPVIERKTADRPPTSHKPRKGI